MANSKVEKAALVKYVDAASNLADSVKRNIQKDGCISNKTVLALNEFIIASNAIADLTEELMKERNQLN